MRANARAADCTTCGAHAWECTCDNVVAGHTPSGYPINSEGHILTELCTPAQRQAISEQLVPRVDFSRRQAT